jgi:hypothetical protein
MSRSVQGKNTAFAGFRTICGTADKEVEAGKQMKCLEEARVAEKARKEERMMQRSKAFEEPNLHDTHRRSGTTTTTTTTTTATIATNHTNTAVKTLDPGRSGRGQNREQSATAVAAEHGNFR